MDRTISFVPPDGEFQLMSYRITDNVHGTTFESGSRRGLIADGGRTLGR
jgi:hypothetical protein